MIETDVPMVDGWTLRPWRDDDWDAYDEIVCDPAVATFLGEMEGGPPVAPTLMTKFDNDFLYMRAAVVRAGDDSPVGLVDGGSSPDGSKFELTIGLTVRGEGAGRAVVRIVNRMVHAVAPDVRVTGIVRRNNTACLAMLRALGVKTTDATDEDYVQA